jgi:hypothetical protein
MGFDDPICGVVGTVTTCAEPTAANAETRAKAAVNLPNAPGEEIIFMGLGFLPGLAKMPPNIARKVTIFLYIMLIPIKFVDNLIISM